MSDNSREAPPRVGNLGLERAVKVALIASLAIAIACYAWIINGELPALARLIVLAPLVGWGANSLALSGIVFSIGYLVPILSLVVFHQFYESYFVLWTAAMFGVALSRPPYTSWSLPPRWRAPLLLWALVIALSWPVVAFRELDFTPVLLHATRGIKNSLFGGLPVDVVAWITSVVIASGVGVLWLDRLFADYSAAELPRFERNIVRPVVVVVALSSVLAVYQAVVDITLFGVGIWPSVGRAAGSLLDANASGMVMALWVFGCIAWVARLVPNADWSVADVSARRWGVVAALTAALALAGAWASGSRSALLALMIGTAGALIGAWRQTAAREHRRRLIVGAATAAVLLAVTLPVWFSTQPDDGRALARIRGMIPDNVSGSDSIRHVLISLLERNNYGIAAVGAIHDSPLVGVGVGTFHQLSTDYAALYGSSLTPPDNAQNWYRHQLAELGILGSIGWIAWVALFILVLIRAAGPRNRAFATAIVQSLTLSIGIVCLVGMPTQNPAVALTFWTLAFWYLLLADPPQLRSELNQRTARLLTAGVWVIAIAQLAGTTYVASTKLRVPARALRAHWYYSHGFSGPKVDASGYTFRDTERRAVEVFPTKNKWLQLTVWANHPDAIRDPVEIRIWRNQQLILRRVARDPTPITRYLQVPAGDKQIMIETWVERTWQSAGAAHGLSVATWEWLEHPPPDADVASIIKTS